MAVPAEQLATVARWAGERRAPLHVHLSEQTAEAFQALAATTLKSTTDEFLKLADQKIGNVHREAAIDLTRRQLETVAEKVDSVAALIPKKGLGERANTYGHTAADTLEISSQLRPVQ